MVFDKMGHIYQDFKRLGFRISDSEQNPDPLQPNLFLTIQSPDLSISHIPTVIKVEMDQNSGRNENQKL